MFIVTTILGRRYSNLWLRLAYSSSAIWLGVLNFSFFAAGAAWIFSGLLALSSFPLDSKTIAGFFFAGVMLGSLYGLLNASWLRVTRVTVKLAGLPEAWRGSNVALVTDLHLGNVRGARFARRVVASLQQLQPEAIFLSGDVYDGSKANLEALIAPWREISAPAGIYFVTGNHEEFTDRTNFIKAVQSAGIRVLQNEKVEINGLQLAGAHDREAVVSEMLRGILRRMDLDQKRPSILLSHRPSNLLIAEAEGVSLQLSGHTHGGQLWPWTWVAARVHGRFNHGLNRCGKMLVYTSNGAGTWGAPMRVGSKSEIVLIRLESDHPG
jgi:hypothetical protein